MGDKKETGKTYKLDNMLSISRLHISHLIAFASILVMISLNVRSFLTLMTLNTSTRAITKCGQVLVSSTYPARFISALNMFVTYKDSQVKLKNSEREQLTRVYNHHTQLRLWSSFLDRQW